MTREETRKRLEQLDRLHELRGHYPVGSEVYWALCMACDLVMDHPDFEYHARQLMTTSREGNLCTWTDRAEPLPN